MILSDSFGESYSLCKSIILESGKPQHMTLERGNCYEEELQRIASAERKSSKKSTTTVPPNKKSTPSTTTNPLETMEASNRHIPLERNATTTSQLRAWKPMTKISSQNITSASVETNEAEPTIELNLGEVLMLGSQKQSNENEKRSFSNGSDESHIFVANIETLPRRDDPIDRSASSTENDHHSEQLRERRGEKETRTTQSASAEDNNANSSNESKFVTVQLFQYRLGDVFERAEKYARNTLFPLLSEQISNIFNFESSEGDADGRDESTDSPIVIKQKNSKKYDEDMQKIDLKSLETMGIQVSAEDTNRPVEKIQRKRNFDPEPSSDVMVFSKDSSAAAVYIDLPTYRPETVKNFIPLIRNNHNSNER